MMDDEEQSFNMNQINYQRRLLINLVTQIMPASIFTMIIHSSLTKNLIPISSDLKPILSFYFNSVF